MGREKKSGKAVWLIHIVCLILLAGTIVTGFRYSTKEYYQDARKGREYEDTDVFGRLLCRDVRNVLNYAELEKRFETNGSLDLNKTVQTVTDESGTERECTLQNAMDYGQSIGLIFNEDNALIIRGDKNLDSEEDLPEPKEKIGDKKGKREDPGSALFNNQIIDQNFAAATSEETVLTEKTVLISLLYQLAEYYEYQRYFGIKNGTETNFLYRLIRVEAEGGTIISTNAGGQLSSDALRSYGKYYSITSETGRQVTNLKSSISENIFYDLEYEGILSDGTYELMVAVDTTFVAKDQYAQAFMRYNQFLKLYRILMALGITLLLGLVISFCGLVFTGRQNMKGFDLWYTEFSILGTILPLIMLYCGIREIMYGYQTGFWIDVVTGLVLFLLAYFPAVFSMLSLIRRIRAQKFVSGFLFVHAVKNIREAFSMQSDRLRSRYRFLVFAIYQIVLILLAGLDVYGITLQRWKLVILFSALLLIWCVSGFAMYCRRENQQRKIFERVRLMAGGEVGRKLDTKGMKGDSRRMAEIVNMLDDSLELAVQERTSSERMKTDLIANVSHDLRTPLTSIISYVDLLKRENIDNDRVKEYLDILENKAMRLKTMAEALMDASRATSGNLTIHWERIDMVQMLGQVLGEFQERFENRNLEPVVHLVDPPAMISADGKILFRVLDNLYTNVCKYAQPGTRVYIDLQETAHSLIYTMKNVSANPLNMTANELTERFIRGDVSRSTEGCGLGLSIAKSMTEQLHGKFELFLDGDYFRVRLVFPMEKMEEG